MWPALGRAPPAPACQHTLTGTPAQALLAHLLWGGYNRSSRLALVVYPGLAGVDEGAGVEDVIHEVPLLHRPHI